MVRELILAAAASVALSAAHAADLEGVSMPDTRVVDGTQMRLNGIGLRTFSALGIRIYVAGLYLERPNGDPETILPTTILQRWRRPDDNPSEPRLDFRDAESRLYGFVTAIDDEPDTPHVRVFAICKNC